VIIYWVSDRDQGPKAGTKDNAIYSYAVSMVEKKRDLSRPAVMQKFESPLKSCLCAATRKSKIRAEKRGTRRELLQLTSKLTKPATEENEVVSTDRV
jgi:hypothetical protein